MTPYDHPVTYHQFFTWYFPDCALVVVDFKNPPAKYIVSCKPEAQHAKEKWNKNTLKELREANAKSFGVYFTPNAVKEERGNGPTHALDNFWYINACYIDIDIPETKLAVFEEDFKRREDKKAEIAGQIFYAPLMPSLTVETRNGFQCYWLTSCDLQTFKEIQMGILEYFKPYGGDPSTIKEVQLMRLPGFLHDKEPVKCKIRHELCTKNLEDGSLKYWPVGELKKAFPLNAKFNVDNKPLTGFIPRNTFKGTFVLDKYDIFKRVLALPILEQMQRANGTKLVGGEILEFMPERNGKIQIRINGKSTPNWLDVNKNLIFSDNMKGFCTIVHYAEFYGLTKREIAEELKKIFT